METICIFVLKLTMKTDEILSNISRSNTWFSKEI